MKVTKTIEPVSPNVITQVQSKFGGSDAQSSKIKEFQNIKSSLNSTMDTGPSKNKMKKLLDGKVNYQS